MKRYIFLIILPLLLFAVPAGAEVKKAPVQRVSKLFDITSSASNILDQPSDIAVSSKGDIYAVDGVNKRVSVYSSNGLFLFSFGKEGGGKGELNAPVGIGISKSDHLFIADRGNSKIQHFDSRGNFMGTIDLSQKNITPIDVAVDSENDRLFITDNKGHRIVVYKTSGSYVMDWGQRGEEDEDFRYPATIWLRKGYIYVADSINSRVTVYRTNGAFIRKVGRWGVLPGKLFRPKGVAVDNSGNVYIADSYMDVIEVFSPEGRFMHVLGDGNGKIRRFISPGGIFIKDDRLYVTEMLENRISVYSLR